MLFLKRGIERIFAAFLEGVFPSAFLRGRFKCVAARLVSLGQARSFGTYSFPSLCHGNVSEIKLHTTSTTTSLSVERYTPPCPRNSEHISPRTSHTHANLSRFTSAQPFHGPNALFALPVRCNACPRLDVPDLAFSVKGTAKEVFTCAVEIEGHNPGRVAGEVRDYFS